jgi:hypothetical protein
MLSEMDPSVSSLSILGTSITPIRVLIIQLHSIRDVGAYYKCVTACYLASNFPKVTLPESLSAMMYFLLESSFMVCTKDFSLKIGWLSL